MTKKQWSEILKDLHSFRLTNKFKNPILYTDNSSECWDVKIDKVDINNSCIRLVYREYITHDDVLNVTPKEMRSRFHVTMNVFEV